jgi:hypothetical protein
MVSNGDTFYMKSVALVTCYAFGPTGQYSVLIFRIPTMFDIIPLKLVRFPKFSTFHKFVFIFVSDFTAFVFVFIFNVKVKKNG